MPDVGKYDAVVLGSGPSGLTAAYQLARAGSSVAVIERSKDLGGLMRSLHHGDFTFDIGRKELYSRFAEVDQLWTQLLGDDYRTYSHRVGVLYQGRILEKDAEYKGALRNMSEGQIVRLLSSFIWGQIRPVSRRGDSLESYYIARYGEAYYRMFIKGYAEKFSCLTGKQLPPPNGVEIIHPWALLHDRKKSGGGFDDAPAEQSVWRHPAKGTGEIIDKLVEGATAAGAEFLTETEVVSVNAPGGRVKSVTVRQNGAERELAAENVISSLPLPFLLPALRPAVPDDIKTPPKQETVFKKSTVLVYLMADGEPNFPHNWLEVTDENYKVGRVVNYATFNGDMVPAGKTGLCMEYFCVQGDEILEMPDEALKAFALTEAADNALIRRERVFDILVKKLPLANAATETHDWANTWLRNATEHVGAISNLYDVNRAGTDRASLAGLDAAASILSGRAMDARSLSVEPATA